MPSNEDTVRSFIAAWSRLDARELLDYFSEDGTYHNMMLPAVCGRDRLLPYIDRFLSGWTQTDRQILTILSGGDIVTVERLDRTRIGRRHIDLPCTGVFEMQDGLIGVWRDYFDLATYVRARDAS